MVPPRSLPAGRFALVALDERNASVVRELGRDAEVRRWTFHRDGMTATEAAALGLRSRRNALQGRARRYVVVEGRAVLGTAGITVVGAVPELYYALLPRARGRGAASSAVRALRDWALDSGSHRVRARVMPGNLGSERVLRAGGFVRVGLEIDRRDGRALTVWEARAR